jgi:hypothetical protein
MSFWSRFPHAQLVGIGIVKSFWAKYGPSALWMEDDRADFRKGVST